MSFDFRTHYWSKTQKDVQLIYILLSFATAAVLYCAQIIPPKKKSAVIIDNYFSLQSTRTADYIIVFLHFCTTTDSKNYPVNWWQWHEFMFRGVKIQCWCYDAMRVTTQIAVTSSKKLQCSAFLQDAAKKYPTVIPLYFANFWTRNGGTGP